MNNDADGDRRVMAILAALLERPIVERRIHLQLLCQGDQELFHEVTEMLDREERMGNFLREPLIAFRDFERPFQAGEVVSERFEIIREIGEGGMGVVYEAFDRKRAQRIAIKSAKPGFRRLLTPELTSALKVRHPNICLVNEIHTTSTSHGEVDFLTMEFLDGQTLSARLSAEGKLGQEEALAIARQICAGLAEAHRSGVIHKDLKSANLILCRSDEGTLRVVMTDFGLAADTALGSHDLGGTPRYIAPELWQGDKPSKASDIYSLGVVLYEMLTGRPPFENPMLESSFASLPPAPSTLVKGLNPRWDKAILQCLDPLPDKRPKDATQVLAPLEKQRFRKTPVLLAAVIVLILVIAALAFRELRLEHRRSANVRLAILPIEPPADLEAIGNGVLNDVADRLMQRQSDDSALDVISASESLSHNIHTPEQAKQTLYATHVLQMTLLREATKLIVKSAIIDLETHTSLDEISLTYSAENVPAWPAALTGLISRTLGLRGIVHREPLSAAATESYFKGLSYLRRDQASFDLAIPLFQQAAKDDPHSPLPRAGLVEALIQKNWATNEPGLLEDAGQILEEAESLNRDSVPVLLAKGSLEFSKNQYDRASGEYKRVEQLEPRNVHALLALAAIDQQKDLDKEATAYYRKAIELEPGFDDTYIQFGDFSYLRGKYSQAASQYSKAIERNPNDFGSYWHLGAALMELARDDEAMSALGTSLKLEKKNYPALLTIGAIKAYQKVDREAVDFYQRALVVEPQCYICLLNLADSSRRLRHMQEARNFYRKGRKIALSVLNLHANDGFTRAYAGYFETRLGNREEGEAYLRQALSQAPNNADVLRCAVLTYESLGRRDQALKFAANATPELLNQLDRHPDLADFRKDPRFRELKLKPQQGE
jgi:serine/threonine protein kinase/Flp pilus assembly protein TadD